MGLKINKLDKDWEQFGVISNGLIQCTVITIPDGFNASYQERIGKFCNFHIWWIYDGFKFVLIKKIHLPNLNLQVVKLL